MSRWWPRPWLSLLLLAMWLLLQQTLHPAHWLLGGLLAWLIPWWLAPVLPEAFRVQAPVTALRLAAIFAYDVLKANLDVALRVIGPQHRLQSHFYWVRLSIRHPSGISLLAGMVTMTPGTLSADLSPDRRHLLVHSLHVEDTAAAAREIQERYEAPLRQIFGELRA